jgi:hypothetical protein
MLSFSKMVIIFKFAVIVKFIELIDKSLAVLDLFDTKQELNHQRILLLYGCDSPDFLEINFFFDCALKQILPQNQNLLD